MLYHVSRYTKLAVIIPNQSSAASVPNSVSFAGVPGYLYLTDCI